MKYEEAIAHLDGLINHEAVPRAGAVAGLSTDPMVEIMAMLGEPHRSYPVIHVTGTNGKGSSVRMMEALLEGMGLRTGAYLSPHLESTAERIRTGGETISEDAFGEVIGDVVLALEAHDTVAATWFETVTAAALLHFANEAVDVAVIEVGMLGRYDATNVVEAQVACVTNVGLDHSTGEGDWQSVIAGEKAGIIEATSTLVLGEEDPRLVPIFLDEGPERAVVRGHDFDVVEDRLAVGGRLVSLRTPRAVYDDVFLGLHGSFQATNASLAVTAVEEFFGAALPGDVVEEALGGVIVPGRLEFVRRSPMILLDTAHNVPGAVALAETLTDDFSHGGRRFLLLGMQDGRVPIDICRALRVHEYQLVVTCTAPTARGIHADALAAAVRSARGTADAVVDVDAAIEHLLGQAEDDDLIVVAGTNPVVGRIRSIADEL